MFFNKTSLLVLFVLGSLTAHSQNLDLKQIFKESTCVRDMKRFYPYILKGELEDPELQDRFFNCIRGFLDLIVNKNLITHDPERDHFKRDEIFGLFNFYLEYDTKQSELITNGLLVIKKFIVGGSIDKLKDTELSQILRLLERDFASSLSFDLEEESVLGLAYFIMHRHIPVLKRVFKGESITINERKKLNRQLDQASRLLAEAYKKANIDYTLEDLHKYSEYLNLEDPHAKKLLVFVQNLLQGVVYPQKVVKGDNWTHVFQSIEKSLDLIFYHSVYYSDNRSEPETAYLILQEVQLFIKALESDSPTYKTQGFPLQKVDGMLQALVSLFLETGFSKFNKQFAHLKDKQTISFITRALTCFSLGTSKNRPCKSDWDQESSVVNFHFPDSVFKFFKDTMTKEEISGADYFINSKNLRTVKAWIREYQSELKILTEDSSRMASYHQFDHWLDTFFGWKEDKHMIFGEFHTSDNDSKIFHFLNYNQLITLLLSSQMPKNYFFSSDKLIDLQIWQAASADIAPMLSVLGGLKGFKASWLNTINSFFSLADNFLNSSNQDELLSSKELLDLTIHLIEAKKSSDKAFLKVSTSCEKENLKHCATKTLLDDNNKLLSNYPRFKDYIVNFQKHKYVERIEATLGDLNSDFTSLDFLPLFVLIQIMEVNYYKLDTNHSTRLESEELLVFANQFKDQVSRQIPYLYNSDQALAYIMYSFKTGTLPFFTGTQFEPLKFTHWYLNHQYRPYRIIPSNFHFLAFDFFQLYTRY